MSFFASIFHALLGLLAILVPGGCVLLGAYLVKKYRQAPVGETYLNDEAEISAMVAAMNKDTLLRKRLFWILAPIAAAAFILGLFMFLIFMHKATMALIGISG